MISQPCDQPDTRQLRALLGRIDGNGYKSYRDLRGAWGFSEPLPFQLLVDHVQADPFAAPSRVRVRIEAAQAGFPATTYSSAPRRRGLCSYLALRFARIADELRRHSGTGRSGLIDIDKPGQEILERTCVLVDDSGVEARFVVGLPAAGRRVLGDEAADLLCVRLPQLVARALPYAACDPQAIDDWTHTAEDGEALRSQLDERQLVAFVADGACLPRLSGVDERPLPEAIVAFASPESLRVELQTPNAGPVTGMGLPRGVNLIVGGGFHGKSALLAALSRGVYDHRPGDGRELVVTDPWAVKVRAEDGRRTAGVDVSCFIGELPDRRDTGFFCTDNASGSTSQAAGIMEAIEAGARVLLIDEDTAATNFMIRDGRMQELVAREHEPITPFIDRVRELYEETGVSTVLVMGGCGDYFGVADTVIAMESYRPRDVTVEARRIAGARPSDRRVEVRSRLTRPDPRIPLPSSIDARRGPRPTSWKVRGPFELQLGEATIDLSAVEQLVDASQTRAIAEALIYGGHRYVDGRRSLTDILDRLLADIEDGGLDVLTSRPSGDLAGFRRHELAATLNRLRTLQVRPPISGTAA